MSSVPSMDDDDDFNVVAQSETSAATGQIYADFCRVGEPFQVYIARDALKRALRHTETGYAETGGEVAGALIGSLQHDTAAGITFVEINETVPVRSFSANFDVAIDPTEWSKAEDITQQPQFRGRCVIVGWYHSHPNIGVFLSAVDLNTQATHFGVPWQIAIVIDPVRLEIGAFNGQAGSACPLYIIPSSHDTALVPAGAALGNLDEEPAPTVVRVPAWRSPLVLGVVAVLLLLLGGLAAFALNTQTSTSTKLQAAAETATYVAYNATISADATETVRSIYGELDASGFATLTAVSGLADATSVAIQTQVAVEFGARTNAYFATATAQTNAMQIALASAQNGQTATAIVANAAVTASADQFAQAALMAQATLTANTAGRAHPTNGVQQTAVAAVTATRSAAENSVSLTATVRAVASQTAAAQQAANDAAAQAAGQAAASQTAVANRQPTASPRGVAQNPTAVPPTPRPPTAVPPTLRPPTAVPPTAVPPTARPPTPPPPPTATPVPVLTVAAPPTATSVPPTAPPTATSAPPTALPTAAPPPTPPPRATATAVPPPTVPPPPTAVAPPPNTPVPPTAVPPSPTPVPPPTNVPRPSPTAVPPTAVPPTPVPPTPVPPTPVPPNTATPVPERPTNTPLPETRGPVVDTPVPPSAPPPTLPPSDLPNAMPSSIA